LKEGIMKETVGGKGSSLRRQEPVFKSVMGLTSSMLYWILALTVVACAAGVVHLWVRHQNTKLGYAISEEDSKRQGLETMNTALKIQLTSLKSGERLEPMARKTFGMDRPGPGQFVDMSVAASPKGGVAVKVASP
jgi:cell division protein FtsL